jgi:hypothetical protein
MRVKAMKTSMDVWCGATKLTNILAVVDGYGKEHSGLVCLIFVGRIECFKRERENQNYVSSVEHIRT